jgi:hypothetical protein
MEEFFGHDMDKAALEVRALRIDPVHRSGEASLATTRWFDYRQMHPTTATYYFAHLYRLQTQRFYAATIDEDSAQDVRAFTPDDIFFSRYLTAMWNARRMCDEHGLPYDMLLRFAQERFIARMQHQFPRPNQLYGEEVELDILPFWQAQIARQITYAKSARFRMSQYKGEVVQAQHIRFVIEQVRRREGPHHRLLARLVKEDVLSLHLVASNFGQGASSDAEQYIAKFM